MLDQETKRRIDTARQILVGKVPDPKAQVEQITTALIYKFMDDMDRENEELGGKAKFLTGKLKQYSWGRLLSKELSGQERMLLYIDALNDFSKAEQIPELFRTIFKGTFLPYRDAETLNLFLKEINGFSYDHSEELGNSFEYLLSVLGAQGKAGQFRTPRHIIDFIVEVVDPKKDDKILDPACGTAGFLISAYKHIKHSNSSNFKAADYVPSFSKKAVSDVALIEIQSNGDYRGDKLTPDARKKLAKNIIGYDISPDMVRLSLVNMYLHGFNTPQIFEYDTLTYEDRWGDNFDVILANPPFMSPKGGIRPHKRFRISANRSEVLFVDYIAEHLTLKGRAGVIVPEGIIFQSSNAYKDLRKMLIEDNILWAVVSLPAGVFKPYSGVKTSILFFDRERAKQNDEILFVKVSNDGFDLGDQRRAIDKNDLPEAYRALREWQNGRNPGLSIAHAVKKEAILESVDFNITGDRYKSARVNSLIRWPMVKLEELFEKVTESVDPKEHEGSVKYIGLENIESDSGRLVGNVNGSYDSIKSGKTKFRIGQILYGKLRPNLNKVHLATFNGICSTDIYVLNSRTESVNARFCEYLLRSAAFNNEVLRGLGGAQLPRVSWQHLSRLEIPLPPLEVQKEIVAELDGYQRFIDGARQIVDNWKPTIKIDPKWATVKLGEVCKLVYGYTDTGKKQGDARYIRITDIADNGDLKRDDLKYIRLSAEAKKYLLKKGDLVVARTGATYGKTLYFDSDQPSVYASFLIRLEFDPTVINNRYYWYFSQSETYWNQAKKLVSGGGQPQFNAKAISEINIPVPPLNEQERIVEAINVERESVKSAKNLIEIQEQKIKNKIAEVWGD